MDMTEKEPRVSKQELSLGGVKWSEDRKKWWDDQSDEYKLEWSEDGKRRQHDLQKISSGSTEERTYYAID